jgi:hypothetical protein
MPREGATAPAAGARSQSTAAPVPRTMPRASPAFPKLESVSRRASNGGYFKARSRNFNGGGRAATATGRCQRVRGPGILLAPAKVRERAVKRRKQQWKPLNSWKLLGIGTFVVLATALVTGVVVHYNEPPAPQAAAAPPALVWPGLAVGRGAARSAPPGRSVISRSAVRIRAPGFSPTKMR